MIEKADIPKRVPNNTTGVDLSFEKFEKPEKYEKVFLNTIQRLSEAQEKRWRSLEKQSQVKFNRLLLVLIITILPIVLGISIVGIHMWGILASLSANRNAVVNERNLVTRELMVIGNNLGVLADSIKHVDPYLQNLTRNMDRIKEAMIGISTSIDSNTKKLDQIYLSALMMTQATEQLSNHANKKQIIPQDEAMSDERQRIQSKIRKMYNTNNRRYPW